MAESLESALSKVRPHTSSSLAHQKAPATLLLALEDTFRDQNADTTPTAYFAALLTTLDGALRTAQASGPALGDGDVVPAVLYLLAIVAPHVPPAVIRSSLNTIITLTSPLFPKLFSHAPPLRSQLGLYSYVFQALERPQLDAQGLRQSFMSILQLCIDPRPKVRKKAAELVRDVLATPPLPLSRHPYAERVAEWVRSSLSEINASGVHKFKGKQAETDGADTAIHILAFIRPVVPSLPLDSLPSITACLLQLPRLGNPYLTQSCYSILGDMLSLAVEDPANNIHEQLSELIKAVLSSPPTKTDAVLAPSWASVLGNAMLAYHSTNPEACAKEIEKVWKAVWPILEFSDPSARKAATSSLDSIARCFTQSLIKAALHDQSKGKSGSVINNIIAQADKALDSLAFARSVPEVLTVMSSLLSNLRYRKGSRTSPTAAEFLMLSIIQKIAALRIQKNFEYKEAADQTLSTAMRVLGPEVLLKHLPLNLEPADRKANLEPRAFFLPMLAQPHPSPLGHFVNYFVPLTERMFDYQQKAETEGRQSEAKVWSVLVQQIWTGLPGYCWCTVDLKQALTTEFSQLLSQLLYSQPELRPAILRALKIMVESNKAIASGEFDKLPENIRVDTISADEAAANLEFLRSQADSWLAVLFNVFSSIGKETQGSVGEVISAWISIASAEAVTQAYQRLVTLFKEKLPQSQTLHHQSGPNSPANVTAVTQDLIVLILSHLSPTDAQSLFALCLASDILENKDNGVQKRGYKILAKLVESDKVKVDASVVIQELEKVTDELAPAAKKDRFHLLTHLVTQIPTNQLHIIPSMIPEAVLGTKEPSEKARNAAFDFIVAMGKKMSEGGVVKRNLLDGMEEDGAGEAKASVEEYITMVAGGLAGASPHMISATVTALSRLVFEFREVISAQMHTELFATLLVFVTSANREIVKSVLGYVKLAVHTLPVDLLRPHLKELVPALLRWSHDHKNHFKEKVRHIFERMIRRFGWEDVYSCAGEDEARKVLVNIKKRKDRAKRKKARMAEEGEDEEEETTKKATHASAFEDVLYGSESEIDESDEEEGDAEVAGRARRKDTTGGARLRIDADEPMDLLQGAASHITTAASKKQRQPGRDAARFKTDEETGKMVIDEESQEEGEEGDVVAGDAYRESLTSTDGITRGPNGRIKFNKDTKKRRRMEEDMGGDVDMADAEVISNKKSKRKDEPRLGQEFKAKKAGGDVKKGGVDPYAYMSLSQAAKKSGRKGRLGVAGKR